MTSWRHPDPHPRTPGDRDLVAMAMSEVAADRDLALELIFLRYREPVLRRCGAVLDRERAVDAAQESFEQAMRSLLDRRPPDDPDKLRPWLLGIAWRVALKQCRNSRQVPVPEIDPAFDDPAEHARTEAARIADEQRSVHRKAQVQKIIEAVVATLTPAQARVYDLHVARELTGTRLAEELGTSPAQASRKANEVRALVRDGFGAYVLARWALRLWRAEGTTSCQKLGSVLARESWNGENFTAKLRQDVHQHVRSCGVCRGERDRHLRPYAPVLFPLLFLPVLSERMPDTFRLVCEETSPAAVRTSARPRRSRRRAGRRATQAAGALVAVAVLIAAAVLVGNDLPSGTPLPERYQAAAGGPRVVTPSGTAPSGDGGSQDGGAVTSSPGVTASPGGDRPSGSPSPGPATPSDLTPTGGPDASPGDGDPFVPDGDDPEAGDDPSEETPEDKSPDAAPVRVPDVLSEDYDRAEATLRSLGLVPARVDQKSFAYVGMTLYQDPAPGTEVPAGATVTVTVSIGGDEAVPNVIGDSQATALTKLRDAGFTVQEVFPGGSAPSDLSLWHVGIQNPVGGTVRRLGTSVTITYVASTK